MRLRDFNKEKPRQAVTKEFEIVINENEQTAPLYIYGPDKVRLDRYANYYLAREGEESENNAIAAVIQFAEETDYGSLEASVSNTNVYIFHANKKNKLGKLVLVASYNGKEYTKTIEIIPLW